MLLSSIGRASFARVVTTISCSKYRAVHILLNAHRIKSTYFRKESFTSNSIDFSRQSYATAARSSSGVKQKPKLSSTKSRRPASKSKGAKISKKASSILKKKKIVKKVVKKTKKPKKALTEKEKLTRKQTSLRLLALKLPDKLPQTARTLFMADKLKGNGGVDINTRFTEISTCWKNLSPPEVQFFQKQAEINRAANEKKLKEWVYKHSPDQIRLANNARRQLSRLYPKSNQWRLIQDDRQPKRPVTPFLCYIKERYSTGEYAGKNLLEISKKLTSEFKALTPNDRKKYDDLFHENRLKYIDDFRQTFNRDPKCQKSIVE
ncbi:putative hmg box protein [Golovinomyces cichoracearum]|uniref:Putative hmg box protein n=1 Tax=Golovinomyces cichoracearum TaxID=62708 RepID=A0A420IDG6_9PEZI|nr:putative hmg box protein [Golovinomyces cichoracearum]